MVIECLAIMLKLSGHIHEFNLILKTVVCKAKHCQVFLKKVHVQILWSYTEHCLVYTDTHVINSTF